MFYKAKVSKKMNGACVFLFLFAQSLFAFCIAVVIKLHSVYATFKCIGINRLLRRIGNRIEQINKAKFCFEIAFFIEGYFLKPYKELKEI